MSNLFPHAASPAAALAAALESGACLAAPGCYDAITARIVEEAGFAVAFLGGFAVSAAKLGLPDVGLLSYGEILDQARYVTAATSIPVIADADTGYGNPINAQRTMLGFSRAGVACVMIEDQEWPKQCGHTAGKAIVDRQEAIARVKACVAAREEQKLDTLIMARTDAAAVEGFEEALWRCQAFADAGADLTFLEAPQTVDEMREYCTTVPGWKTANLVEDGMTPWLAPQELGEIGYSVVLYPVSLLLHSIQTARDTAAQLRAGVSSEKRAAFDDARKLVGWPDYDARIEALNGDNDG